MTGKWQLALDAANRAGVCLASIELQAVQHEQGSMHVAGVHGFKKRQVAQLLAGAARCR